MAESFFGIAFRTMTSRGVEWRTECSDSAGEFQVRYGLVETVDDFFGKFKFGIYIVLMTLQAF